MDLEGVQFLAVTSNFPKKFRGRFHGTDYLWKPGDTVNMPVDAAVHIFGFGEEDKTRALHRAGFLTTMEEMDAAMEKLGQFSFAPVEQVFELTQTRRSRRRRETIDVAQISNDRSPVNAGGSEGESERPFSPDDPDEEDEDDDDDEAGAGAR